MIRIHPGRAWRQNSRLLSQLRAATGERPGIVDAVGIEIDGVDLAAGLSEDSVLHVTSELAAAVASLASGRARASVGFRAAGVELLLERRHERVRLSLVQLRPPTARNPRGVDVELEALCRAALESSRTLLRELGAINPALLRGPAGRRLASAVRSLSLEGERPSSASPGTAKGRTASRAPPRAPPPTPGMPSCALRLDDEAGLLASFRGRRPDLQSLLVRGRLGLRLAAGSTLWEGDGYLFLMLREQTAAGLALVRALEAGEAEHAFPLCDGGALALDLEAGTVLPPRHRKAVRCSPLALARCLFEASRQFAAVVVAWHPKQRGNGYLAELQRSAEEGLARCTELSKPLPAPRRARRARALPAPAPEPPLVEGRLRRLRYRKLWTSRLPHATSLCVSGSQVVACTETGALGLSASDGHPLWSVPRGSGSALALPAGELLVAAGKQLVRFAADGAPRWSASPLGPSAAIGSLALTADGRAAIAASQADIVVFLLDSGRALWRFGPPGCGALTVATAPALCLLGTSDGRLYGIDPGRGRVVWRSRLGTKLVGPLVVWDRRVAVLSRRPGGAGLHAVDLDDGRPLELPEPELAHPGPLCVAGGQLVLAGTLGGEGRVLGYDETGPRWSWRGGLLGPGIPQLCPTPEGVVVRGSRRAVCLDGSGRPRWELPFEEELHGGPAPLVRRGVLFLLADQGLLALDPRTGRILGEAGSNEPLWPSLLAADDRLTLFTAEEEGPLEAHALETFLSVV
ncbi:MAG: outer membrane protein assembly factor BamB family protein [Myxococcales bacterium]